MDDYCNHNAAYHPWLIDIATRHRGHVLDVGCGEGLLAKRLAGVSRSIVGVDSDPASVWRASERLQSTGNASVELMRFETFDADQWSFDLMTFVASIHHLPLRESLQKGARNAHARRGTGNRRPFGQQEHCRLDLGCFLHASRARGVAVISRDAQHRRTRL